MADSGKIDTVIFIASDNGSPVESDTESVIIIVSSTPVNLAPRWISNEQKEFAIAGTTFEYELSNKCFDPDNDKLTLSLISEAPAGDTIVGTEYFYTPSVSDTGKHTIHIVARDPSGLEDILTLELTVATKGVEVDNEPPVFTRVTPATDSTKVTSSTIQLSVLCKDQKSGVDSVKCFMGTIPFNVTKTGDSLYSATVSGLIAGWNTISFAARDTSPAKNACTLFVHLNYEKDLIDKTPPVITFQSPSKDTIISADSFEVKVSCVDDSGCSVRGYRDTTAFTLKKSASVKNLWTGVAKGIAAGSYSTIKIVATDSSAAKNKDSAMVRIKYDNDKSGPVVTLVKPTTKSTATNTSSYSIELKYTDASGVLSVNGALGATTISGVRSGDNWVITMSNLVLGNNTVVITATDSSFRANKTNDTITIKYDPTMEDADGPIIKQIGNPASGSIVNSAVVEITDSISDPSGIDSVYWIHNNGTKKIMTPVTGKTGVYSLKDTLREGVLDSLVITATDKSTRKNRSQQVITLTYVVPPSITKQPVSQTACSGSQAIFSLNATGTGPLSYQWRTGTVALFTNIGSNSPVCTLTTAAATIISCVVSNQAATNATSSSTYYVRGETSSCGNSAWDSVRVTVNILSTMPTSITANPSSNVCPNSGTITLTVNGGSLGSGASWRWYSDQSCTVYIGTGATILVTTLQTYYVRAEGTCNTTETAQITLTLAPLTITPSPAYGNTCVRDIISITPSCQAKSVTWYYNPFGIPGDDRLITSDNSSFTILGNTIRCNTDAGSDVFCIVKDNADREVKSGTWVWWTSFCGGAY